METFYDIYQKYLKNPYSGVETLSGVNPSSGTMNTIPQSEGRTVETTTPIQTSIQQQLAPVGPFDAAINQYLQLPGLLSLALTMGKDYIGLTDAQKDLYGSLGFGYSDQSGLMKDKLGFNVMASNFLDPKSTSRSVYKDKLGYTDEELDKIRNDLAGVPTKTDMRQQQRDYDIAQTQRQQNYFDLANQGIMGIGLNPGAYAAHSLAAMGPAYDNPYEFSKNVGSFGGPQSISADDISMSVQAAQEDAATAAAAAAAEPGGSDNMGSFATGGRVGYAEGSITQEGVIPGFTKLKNPDGAPGNYNEFMYEGPDGQIYGAGTYSSIAAGMYPNIYEPSTLKSYSNIPELTQLMSDVNQKAGTTVIRNLEEADAYLKANAQTTPTVAEQIISTNNLSPFSSAPLTTSMAEKLFPQGDFLNIKETATSPTEYNIEATKDLVENLPGGIVKDIVAPTAAFALSLPYDAIQAYQRMEPGSGIQGFGKAFQAERPLESAFERFTGAAGPLAENINTAISSLNPFQKQQYMNYAVQNPDQAIAAAQRNKDFLAATQKNTNPATSAPASMADGGRVFYLQGGLASLLG
jgi:hypothetical protein